jgi:hypothetical protein
MHPLMTLQKIGTCYWCCYILCLLIASIQNYSVVIKVGMVGDSQIGKTSLMVKYVEGSFDEDYIQTLGKRIYSFSNDIELY